MSKVVKAVLSPIKTLLGMGDKPSTPQVKPPAPMPTPDDERIEAARRRRMAQTRSRSGRASTILTSDEDRLGG